jgi:hypothetical protein
MLIVVELCSRRSSIAVAMIGSPKIETPVAIAFVGSQDDAAAFVACADQVKKNGGAHVVQRKISRLALFIDAEHLSVLGNQKLAEIVGEGLVWSLGSPPTGRNVLVSLNQK